MSDPVTVAGVDLSLTSTGLAKVTPRTMSRAIEVDRFAPRTSGHVRMQSIAERVVEWTDGADLVCVESPAFHAVGKSGHELAGNWWVVTHELWMRGRPVALINPTWLKMYATGRGNASKEEVLLAASRHFPDADLHGNDEADALWLAAMGLDHLGRSLLQLPQKNRSRLDHVDWPRPLIRAEAT